MAAHDETTDLADLLNRLAAAVSHQDRVALGTLIEAVGDRSFGPLLLLAGLIALSPLSGIPGMPTTVGVIVALIAGQLLAGRKFFWLPEWVLSRSVSRRSFERALRFLRRPARFIDRFLRPRFTIATRAAGAYAIAVLSLMIAIMMPPMEVVPFAATTAGAALTAFGLALIARDGVMATIAFLLTGGVIGIAFRVAIELGR